jgi:hypothetical protein
MPTLFEFSQQIATLKKEKKFSEALSYFRENKGSFSKEQIGNNEYIVSDMISCLRYSNHLEAGFCVSGYDKTQSAHSLVPLIKNYLDNGDYIHKTRY